MSKTMSERDAGQTLQLSYNDVNATLGVDGFIVGKLGRKIVRTLPSAAVEQYDFYDGSTLLYTLQITYTDATLATLSQVERTA